MLNRTLESERRGGTRRTRTPARTAPPPCSRHRHTHDVHHGLSGETKEDFEESSPSFATSNLTALRSSPIPTKTTRTRKRSRVKLTRRLRCAARARLMKEEAKISLRKNRAAHRSHHPSSNLRHATESDYSGRVAPKDKHPKLMVAYHQRRARKL